MQKISANPSKRANYVNSHWIQWNLFETYSNAAEICISYKLEQQVVRFLSILRLHNQKRPIPVKRNHLPQLPDVHNYKCICVRRTKIADTSKAWSWKNYSMWDCVNMYDEVRTMQTPNSLSAASSKLSRSMRSEPTLPSLMRSEAHHLINSTIIVDTWDGCVSVVFP